MQQGWSEHNARVGQLADCAKKEAGNAPPKANQSMGPPTPTVPQDVDVYAQPGGEGKPIGMLKGGSKVLLLINGPISGVMSPAIPCPPVRVGFGAARALS